MSSSVELVSLQNQRLSFLRMLAMIPPESPLRIGYENRLELIECQIKELEDSYNVNRQLASVDLYFGGEPVVGSEGVNAVFALGFLTSFQSLVSKMHADDLKDDASGRLPQVSESSLYITNTLEGSFGFQLKEMQFQQELGIESSGLRRTLKDTVEEASEVIRELSSLDGDADDEYNDILAEIGKRAFSEIRSMFKLLFNHGATLRIAGLSEDVEVHDHQVARVYEALKEKEMNTSEIEVNGFFLGITPLSGRFEFKSDDGDIYAGGVVGFSEDDMTHLNRVFSGVRCTVVISELTVSHKKTAKTKTTYSLSDVREFQTE